MTQNEVKLNEIKYPHDDPFYNTLPNVIEWDRYDVEALQNEYGKMTIFVYSRQKQHFYFVAIDLETQENGVEVYCWGEACYDGIRHFFIGSKQTKNEGYIYCLYTKVLKEVLNKLESLMDHYQIEYS